MAKLKREEWRLISRRGKLLEWRTMDRKRINDDMRAFARLAGQLSYGASYVVPLLLPLKRIGRNRAHWRRLAVERCTRSPGFITGWPGRCAAVEAIRRRQMTEKTQAWFRNAEADGWLVSPESLTVSRLQIVPVNLTVKI